MLTLDLQILRKRHKDIKNGLSAPSRPTLANPVNLATKLCLCVHMMVTRRHGFGNIVGHVREMGDLGPLAAWTAQQFDPRLNWSDVEWIRNAGAASPS